MKLADGVLILCCWLILWFWVVGGLKKLLLLDLLQLVVLITIMGWTLVLIFVDTSIQYRGFSLGDFFSNLSILDYRLKKSYITTSWYVWSFKLNQELSRLWISSICYLWTRINISHSPCTMTCISVFNRLFLLVLGAKTRWLNCCILY